MPSIFTLRSSTLRSGADLRAAILALSQSPATVTVTPVALGVSAAISLALSPATITVTPVALACTVGGVSAALSPATITTTPVSLGRIPGAVSIAQSSATVTVTAVTLGRHVLLPSDPCQIQDEAGNPITDEAGNDLLIESCVETTTEAETPVGGGKWDVTQSSREAWRKQIEAESMLAREDEELLLCLL